MSAGVGPFFSAKQFRFDELFWQCGAVDLNKGFGGSRALFMDGSGHDGLAGARLAQQQNSACTAAGNALDRLPKMGHGLT